MVSYHLKSQFAVLRFPWLVVPSGGKGMAPCSSTLWSCDYGTCPLSNFTVATASIVLRKDQISSLQLATTLTATKTATAAESSVSVTSIGITTPTVTASSTATCAASPHAIVTTAPANSTSTSSLAAVGAGVGVPIAIAAAAAIALLFRERRQSNRLRLENQQILAGRRDNESKAIPITYVSEARQPQELMGHQPQELMGNQPNGMAHRMG
ncbi:MAG: hypothetical protein LQ347_005787 [Umbilicaria vellea]|nr:MAG: hypothetical protein LQ347_005787 [Umbilicaria vellea]